MLFLETFFPLNFPSLLFIFVCLFVFCHANNSFFFFLEEGGWRDLLKIGSVSPAHSPLAVMVYPRFQLLFYSALRFLFSLSKLTFPLWQTLLCGPEPSRMLLRQPRPLIRVGLRWRSSPQQGKEYFHPCNLDGNRKEVFDAFPPLGITLEAKRGWWAQD